MCRLLYRNYYCKIFEPMKMFSSNGILRRAYCKSIDSSNSSTASPGAQLSTENSSSSHENPTGNGSLSAKEWIGKRRQSFLDWMKRHKRPILSGLVVTSIVSINYYRNHLQTTPITNRSRFIALTKDQFADVCRKELEKIRVKYVDSILPTTDPRSKRVVYVLSRLVSRNHSVPEINRLWHVALIDSEEKHAKSISTGYIFVSTGLLNYVANDDQLGILLSHEMAHALLQHDLEKVSWVMLMQTVWQGLSNVLGSLSPFGVQHFLDATRDKLVDTIQNLPYGRALEREADELGLQLAARACFDPQEAYAYWAGFTPKASVLNNMHPILAKWIYHHPSYGDRSDRIERLMEKMCDIRSKAGCPPMSKCDLCALLEMKRRMGHMDEAMVKEGCQLV